MIGRWALKSLLLARARFVGSTLAVSAALLLVITFRAVWQGETEQLAVYLERAGADVWVMQDDVSNVHMSTSFIARGKRTERRSPRVRFATDTVEPRLRRTMVGRALRDRRGLELLPRHRARAATPRGEHIATCPPPRIRPDRPARTGAAMDPRPLALEGGEHRPPWAAGQLPRDHAPVLLLISSRLSRTSTNGSLPVGDAEAAPPHHPLPAIVLHHRAHHLSASGA